VTNPCHIAVKFVAPHHAPLTHALFVAGVRARGNVMQGDAVGLLARLAGFLNTLAGTGPHPVGAPRRPEPDRHQLAVQLLGTLTPEVLAETGHRKPYPRRRVRTEDLVLRQPHPPPVGDLSRPR